MRVTLPGGPPKREGPEPRRCQRPTLLRPGTRSTGLHPPTAGPPPWPAQQTT
jgi:hypothetical protein